MPRERFRIHLGGRWSRSQVRIEYKATEYVLPGDFVRRAIKFWEMLPERGNRRIFNGALCRLEKFTEHEDTLQLSLSRTCYRDLLFSNAHTDELLHELGESGPVRGLGISAIIETADGFLPLIRRSEHLGEAPGGIDVIGGHVHPDEHTRNGVPDVFLAIADEVHAELGVPLHLLDNLICCGLAENWSHRKPELAFFVALPLTMREVQQFVQTAHESEEFTELFSVRSDTTSLQHFIAENEARITSAAHGCLRIYQKMRGLTPI